MNFPVILHILQVERQTLIKQLAVAARRIRHFRYIVKQAFFCIICMGIVTIIVIGDFFISGLSRRTITFYAEENREPLIEERFISWKWNEEKDIHAFVEEILLGPEYPDTAALLDRGTRLETFFYRDGRAVIGLSEEAAIPIGPLYMPRADIQESLRSISRDLRRNFLSVHEIYFFIAGREVKIEP